MDRVWLAVQEQLVPGVDPILFEEDVLEPIGLAETYQDKRAKAVIVDQFALMNSVSLTHARITRLDVEE